MAIIGIDLGTSNSAAAVLRGGRPVIIPSAEGVSLGGKAFPSYVALTADGQTLVGEPARRQAAAKDAEEYAEADKQRREEAEQLNEADAVCYQAERMLADFSDKLTDELRGRIQQAMQKTREAITKRDAASASQCGDALTTVLKEAGVVIYSQQPGSSVYQEVKAGNRPRSSTPGARVIDADFEEKQ